LEISEVTGAEVRHGMVFEISPDVFNRVELGSIGGQILQGDLSIQTFQVLLHESRTVRLKPIPDYEQLFADRRCECLQELHDLWTLDRAGEESKVEAPEAHSSNHRQLLPGKAVLQDWCLAPWGPGARAAGSFGQTRLVDEDDYSALPRSDFFMAGHLFCFHVRIAASSRWRASPAGRCTLQPSCCSCRHTEDCENSIPKRSLISMPIRGSVHSSLAKPAANAPAFSALISSARCASSS